MENAHGCYCIPLESIVFLTQSQKECGHQDLQTLAHQVSFYGDLKKKARCVLKSHLYTGRATG
jgi:hypothetical protein